jgi:hypothetical protein
MFVNGTADQIANMIPTAWSPLLYQELRNKVAYLNLFARDYEGEIKEKGNTVKVNQVKAPTGEILTNDKDTFNPEELQVGQFEITADRRAVASFEITDMAKLQSLDFQMEVANALVYSIQLQMEKDIQSVMIPSAAAPDHQLAALIGSSFDVVDVIALRNLLAEAKVMFGEDTYLALGSTYYGSLLGKNQVVSSDFGSVNDLMAGEVRKLSGFKVFEHVLESATKAVAFHKSAVQVVAQTQVNVKVSDLHVNKKFGYLVSADIVYGRKLADDKRIANLAT